MVVDALTKGLRHVNFGRHVKHVSALCPLVYLVFWLMKVITV